MRNLMRDSVLAIRGMRFVSARGDAVFALGSIGTEKAMKVLLGCAAVEDTGSWPTKPTLKDRGHDVEELSDRGPARYSIQDDRVRYTLTYGGSRLHYGRSRSASDRSNKRFHWQIGQTWLDRFMNFSRTIGVPQRLQGRPASP